MNPIITTPPRSDFRTLILPDLQRFQAASLVHIDISSATLSIWLSGLATAVSYTASSDILAWFLMVDIFRAASQSGEAETQLALRGQAGVSITSLSPDPLAAAGAESVTLTGTGFQAVQNPVVNVAVGGSGGITYYPCTDVVVVDDFTLTFTTPAWIVAGAANVLLSSNQKDNIAAIGATSIT